jgi:hypothetical protein
LGPFHQTEIATVKMVLNSGPDGLFLSLKPIEVNMVNPGSWSKICGLIFVHKGKGWTTHHIMYPQYFAQCLDQGGFPGAQISLKSDNLIEADMLRDLVGYFRQS